MQKGLRAVLSLTSVRVGVSHDRSKNKAAVPGYEYLSFFFLRFVDYIHTSRGPRYYLLL